MKTIAISLGLALAPLALYGQGQPPLTCGGSTTCYESQTFLASITDFRAIVQGTNNKTLTARISFRNKLNRPLILGYVQGSGVGTDDRGNRYVPYGPQAVRGIGEIAGNNVDTKFTLRPGEVSEARFEFLWRAGQEIFGLNFVMDLAIREIEPMQGNQLQLGREHALHFSGLSANANPNPVVSGGLAPAQPPAAAPVAAPAAPPAPAVDPCGGRPNCYSAGIFVAEVTGITPSVYGTYDVLDVRVRFRSLVNQPIILAYNAGSAAVSDNLGGRFAPKDQALKGIGMVNGNQADPQFVLNPGASGNVTFQMYRHRAAGVPAAYNFDVTIAQLEILASRQIRTVRDYSVSFTNLGPAAMSQVPGAAPGRAVPTPPPAAAPVDASQAPPAPVADPCGGRPNCYSAGIFVAEVTGITPSVYGTYDILDLRVRFRSLVNQPIILAYNAGSAAVSDNLGGRFAPKDQALKGIGMVYGNQADPQFVLNPGASGNVTFQMYRHRAAGVPAAYNFDVTIAQLEILASRQIRTVRDYSVSFTNLGASSMNQVPGAGNVNDAAKKLGDIFRKKK